MSTDQLTFQAGYHWRLVTLPDGKISPAQKEPGIQLIKAGRKKICLIYTSQKWYAIQPFCPHAGGPFEDGWCENKNITCPYHRYVYDLESGRCLNGEPFYIKTYPVLIQDKNVYIGFRLSRFHSWLSRRLSVKKKNDNLT